MRRACRLHASRPVVAVVADPTTPRAPRRSSERARPLRRTGSPHDLPCNHAHLGLDLTETRARAASWKDVGSTAARPFDGAHLLELVDLAERGTLDFVLFDDDFTLQASRNTTLRGRLDPALIAARLGRAHAAASASWRASARSTPTRVTWPRPSPRSTGRPAGARRGRSAGGRRPGTGSTSPPSRCSAPGTAGRARVPHAGRPGPWAVRRRRGHPLRRERPHRHAAASAGAAAGRRAARGRRARSTWPRGSPTWCGSGRPPATRRSASRPRCSTRWPRAGRDPRDVRVLVDAFVVLAGNEASAQARLELLAELEGVAGDAGSLVLRRHGDRPGRPRGRLGRDGRRATASPSGPRRCAPT